MFVKILKLYKELINYDKKIPTKIKLSIITAIIFLIMGLIAGAIGCDTYMSKFYILYIISMIVLCYFSYKFGGDFLETNTIDYKKVLDDFEKKLCELKIGSNNCIERLIEQCKEYEEVEKDVGLKKIKYIVGIAIIPLITSAGTLIISKMNDEWRIVIFLVSALLIGVGFVIFNLLYDSYIKFVYEYNYLAKKMRYDLELILARRK